MLIQGMFLQSAPGKTADAAELIVQLRDTVNKATGREFMAWSVLTGSTYGTFVLSARLEGSADIVDVTQKLGGDDAFRKLSSKATGVFTGPSETVLSDVIGVAGEPAPAKQFTVMTRATMAGGQFSQAIAWSNEMLEYVHRATGHGGMLTTTRTGGLFRVGWLQGFDSAEEMDTANDKLAVDAGYIERLDQAGDMFVDGSAERAVLYRLP